MKFTDLFVRSPVLAAVVPTYVCPLDQVTHLPQTSYY